jgi:hypothetical protein
MKTIFFVLLFALVAGCATNPNIARNQLMLYIAEERPKALAGTITWTSFYQGQMNLAKSFPDSLNGKYELIADMTEALNMAQQYESGKISKEDFYKWRETGNAASAAKAAQSEKNRAQCEYEARAASASVQATGRSGINFDQIFKERELFELCMRAKQ